MWLHKYLLPLVVLLHTVTYVHSSCDLIALLSSKCECKYPTANRYVISCEHAGLTEMPGRVNYTLPEGDALGNFSYNTIEKVPDFYFLHMKHFDILDFTSNKLLELTKNSFNGLQPRLTTLLLKENKINSVSDMALRDYIRLNELDLSYNQVSSPCKIHTADVTKYSLAHNGITEIENFCFSDARQVEDLDLSGNKISSFNTKSFSGMSSLKKLNLADNQFKKIGEGFVTLTDVNIEYLSMNGNNLRTLDSFCDYVLPHAKTIDFGDNELVDIQQYCFNSYSQSGSSSASLTLHFEYNLVAALAGSAFAGLSDKLVQLYLHHNRISQINVGTFVELHNLVKLNLDNNRINDLEFLRNWEDNTLQELSVANNLIEALAPQVFRKMLKLTKLTLDGNLLLYIESSAFQEMIVLDDLSIRYNLITNLADGAFNGLGQLKKLRLTGNALLTLKNCTFANLDRLLLFHFDDNYLYCDCDLLWLLEFTSTINKVGVPDASIAKPVLVDYCHHPEIYSGMYMVNVVSLNCPELPSNACFGLTVTHNQMTESALNVSWTWNLDQADSSISTVILTQTEVETGVIAYNNTVTFTKQPVELSLKNETIYKICVRMTLSNGAVEIDCTVYPTMIKKPTTTMAPTTEMIAAQTGLRSGDIAAICLGIILIIIIVLIVLIAVYLWKTEKYVHVIPSKYNRAAQVDSDQDHESVGRSPSSNGKSSSLDFRPDVTAVDEDDPMMRAPKPHYEEHDF